MDELKGKFLDLINNHVGAFLFLTPNFSFILFYILFQYNLKHCKLVYAIPVQPLHPSFTNLQRNNNKIPIIDYGNSLELNYASPVKNQPNKETSSTGDCDPKMDEHMCSDLDILDNLDNVYFIEDFNPGRYELEV